MRDKPRISSAGKASAALNEAGFVAHGAPSGGDSIVRFLCGFNQLRV